MKVSLILDRSSTNGVFPALLPNINIAALQMMAVDDLNNQSSSKSCYKDCLLLMNDWNNFLPLYAVQNSNSESLSRLN
jgi:hypothetical protein